jgi:ubiquinone/menaquinone biosynthesis C-methylase UbiE
VRAPPLTPLAAALLHIPVPERALVVGCGDGEAVLLLAREFPTARVRGIDPSQERVRAATARVGLDPEGRVAFKVAKPGALPFPDGFFDLVVHLAGRPAPGELARVLASGGQLAIVRLRPSGLGAGIRGTLLARALRRRGFVSARAETVGDGNFLLARLAEPG